MAAANGDPASNIMVYVIVEMKSEDGDFLSGVYQFISHRLSAVLSQRCVLVYLYLTVCLLYFPCRSSIVYSELYSIRGLKEVFCVFVYY